MTLDKLFKVFKNKGVKRVFIKRLSPNDNSKNQLYFGGDLAVLNILPAGDLIAEQSNSLKPSKTSTRFKAQLNFNWIDISGQVHHAPDAKLIFYPQYPEMRFSGFLRGCKDAPSELMDPYKRGREKGRILILGVNSKGEIFALLADQTSAISKEIINYKTADTDTVLEELGWEYSEDDSQAILLQKLGEIHQKGWIEGKRLTKEGLVVCDNNPNCGGYTMEAELGVSANGYAEPDFMGWEVKQYGVKQFGKSNSHIITLMTPEPDGGVYFYKGVLEFLTRFGYPDKNGKPDRQNFGGIYKYNKPFHINTGLRLELTGYDASQNKIMDSSGGIALVSDKDEVAAIWHYSKLIDHWKRKHAKTVYIPSLRTEKPYHYHFGKDVTLCKGTDFMAFLNAMSKGSIYIDPAIKAEQYSSFKPNIKRRNQIRISFKDIKDIYHTTEVIDCIKYMY